MSVDTSHITEFFKGRFLAKPPLLIKKLSGIKAFVFDWDGVFNNGVKDDNGSSPFSEVDAMGTNLLRFNHFLSNGQPPLIAIFSGETNKAAFNLARREHFHAVYYKVPNKIKALNHFCEMHQLEPMDIAFIFDDVLDFSVAHLCGLRIMVSRASNPLLIDFAEKNRLADYITFNDGNGHAVRESVELITGLSGKYHETIEDRMHYATGYQQYLEMRNKPVPVFYTLTDNKITEQTPI